MAWRLFDGILFSGCDLYVVGWLVARAVAGLSMRGVCWCPLRPLLPVVSDPLPVLNRCGSGSAFSVYASFWWPGCEVVAHFLFYYGGAGYRLCLCSSFGIDLHRCGCSVAYVSRTAFPLSLVAMLPRDIVVHLAQSWVRA